MAAAAKEPIVLVTISGGMVDLSKAKANDKVGAILIAGYPGEMGGLAIAMTLFGDHSPGGKLTQTWYDADFINGCSMFDMNMRPDKQGCKGRTYRFFTGTPVFKFGTGLSYATFGVKQPSLRTFEHARSSSSTLSSQWPSLAPRSMM